MARDISPNKVDDDQERRPDQIESRLRSQGMGEDQADKEALARDVEEKPGSLHGGGDSANEPKKDSSHGGHKRLGSDSNEP
jgi:hypothetical protein